MAYSENIVTVLEMQFMAGENVDATGNVEANHTALQDQAEAYLSNLLKYNLGGTGFSDLDSTLRVIITEWAARYAGVELIRFNTINFKSLFEAQSMMSIHINRMEAIEKILNKSDVQDFLSV